MKTVSAGSMIAAFLFVAIATMLASSPAGAQPLRYCNFFLSGYKRRIPELNICPGGEKAYSRFTGSIVHNVKTDTATVDIKTATVSSDWCAMSSGPYGLRRDGIKCANTFRTIQEWIYETNLQDDAPWFLNKFIKIHISGVQYKGGWGNYRSDGRVRDCVMIKTSSDFANPDGSECPI